MPEPTIVAVAQPEGVQLEPLGLRVRARTVEREAGAVELADRIAVGVVEQLRAQREPVAAVGQAAGPLPAHAVVDDARVEDERAVLRAGGRACGTEADEPSEDEESAPERAASRRAAHALSGGRSVEL